MRLLLDMNISPSWVEVFDQAGHQATHWSKIGSPSAPDEDLMQWAKENQHIVFTHDLDFGAILAATQADGPSVIQLRDQNISPLSAGSLVLKLLETYIHHLNEGALLIMDSEKSRIRILPINPK